MFPTRKRILLPHLNGKVIRTTADHPFFIQGQGWVNAADLPGAKSDGEEEFVYHLNLGEPAMPDQPRPNLPVVGFAAGTPLRTPEGSKAIEQFQPGDFILTGPEPAPSPQVVEEVFVRHPHPDHAIQWPIPGFGAGTPLLTPSSHKPIKDIKPGDLIQTQADEKHCEPEIPDEEPLRWREGN